jgi:hypothetical protein
MSGYPLVQIAFDYKEQDENYMSKAGANAYENIYNNTGTTIYIVDESGNMQMMGCYDNKMNLGLTMEWAEMLKGAMQAGVSKAYVKRNCTLSGNMFSIDGHNLEKLLALDNRGSDGRHTLYQGNRDWKPVKYYEILFVTYSDQGREFILQMPRTAMRLTGDIAMGDVAQLAFEMTAPDYNLYVSDNLMDVHYFGFDQTIV